MARLRFRMAMAAIAASAAAAGMLTQARPVLAADGAASPVPRSAGTASPGGQGQPARIASPARVLPAGWGRSEDRAVTFQGDAAGLHVLAADEKSGYSWRTVATLGDPGVETTQWIGQGCVTASGRYAVVVYAPRQVTNMAGAMGVLGRAAVVDLGTGAVRQLGGGYSVAYFDPGCGTGEDAVLTRGGWDGTGQPGPASTQLQMINAVTGATAERATVPGQATSAIPYQGAIAAAHGRDIERITAGGHATPLARATAVPFRLVPGSSGELGYQVLHGTQTQLYSLTHARTELVGSAPERTVQLVGSGGRIWLTGPHASRLHALPSAWRAADVPAGSVMSTTGELALTGAASGTRSGAARTNPQAALPVKISAQVQSGSRPDVSFTAPAAATGPAPLSPTAGQAARGPSNAPRAAASGSDTTTTSPDRTCAISVDDPSAQAYQPDFQQVEWAADQAVHGRLTDTRPAGLYATSLPSYTPQGMFPLPSLSGGGTVPAQVLLGVLTQESNLEQASVHVDQGQASNPLTSFNWFGNWVDISSGWTETNQIDWGTSDCGYGIGQVTTGMCLSKNRNNDLECEYATPMSATDQLAVAVDYQANIAKATQLLAGDWNQLAADGITMTSSTGTSTVTGANYIDNWYMALWAYNSGLEPGNSSLGNTSGCTPGPTCTDGNGDWGLGYADNPANPAYPPDRPVFPEGSANNYLTPTGGSYSPSWDMSHPQYWTYQEKVISWAFDAVTLYDYNQGKDVQAFAYAAGNPGYPPIGEFCTSADHCDPSGLNTTKPASSGDACQLTGSFQDHCWWHWPASVTCDKSCGTEVLSYALGSAAPADPAIAAGFSEDCTLGGLPSGAVIVGESEPAALGCPGKNWTSAGAMTWQFGAAVDGTNPSKIYLDQIGSGLGGHFWFSYTIPSNAGAVDAPGNPPSTTVSPADAPLEITGTWPAPSSVSGWTNVLVHMPSYGSWDPQAVYQIHPGGGAATQYRVVNQALQQNAWISLGLFDLGSGASVSLNNATFSGLGRDIAWNGIAYVHSAAPVYDYVALGDSYSSGQGLTPYTTNSNYSYNGMASSCNRSQTQAYPDLVTPPGTQVRISQEAQDPTLGYQFHFLACSGQWTTQITENAADQTSTSPYGKVSQTPMTNVPAWNGYSLGYDELPQADQGYLNQNTSLVTMTTGGDDARFAKVLSDCLTVQIDGLGQECESGGTVSGDPQPADVYEPEIISNLLPHLEQVYRTVANDAPNAKIVAIAYPNLFGGDTNAQTCVAAVADAGLASWFNELGDQLRSITEQAVAWARSQGIDIDLINAEPAFAGHHVCDSPNWLDAISTGGGTFHPTPDGQQEFATLVNECLVGTLPSAYTVSGDGSC